MILDTAKRHFCEDIERSRDLLNCAQDVQAGRVQDDMFRSVWMMAVGASDAYFCDAYADLIARTLRANEKEPQISLPERLANLRVPVTAVIRAGGGWRWRMAARELIERQSVLSLEEIKKLFNQFFGESAKIMNASTIEPWILHAESKQRLWGISKTNYQRLSTPQRRTAERKKALRKFEERMGEIFQRRHDCIHNCDRPRAAIQKITQPKVRKAVEDVEFLVNRCHDAFIVEFPLYLDQCGFSAVTKNAVTQ